MNERASPNKQLNLEKGVFSSLSTLAFYKTERKANSTIQPKNPKTRSPIRTRADFSGVSPMRSERTLECSKVSPVRIKRSEEFLKLQEENLKLQETVKKLSMQLSKEKKKGQTLETQLKETLSQTKEFVSLKSNVERAQKTIDNLKHTQKGLLEKKETLSAEVIECKQQMLNATVHLETMANVLIDVVDNIVKPLLEFVEDDNKDLLDNLQHVVLEEFQKISEDLKIDLTGQIQQAKTWTNSQNHTKYEYIQNESSHEKEVNDEKHPPSFDNDIFADRDIPHFSARNFNFKREFDSARRDSIDRNFLHIYDKDLKYFEQKILNKFDKKFLQTIDRNTMSHCESDAPKMLQTYDRSLLKSLDRNAYQSDKKLSGETDEHFHQKNSCEELKFDDDPLLFETEQKFSHDNSKKEFVFNEDSLKDNSRSISERVISKVRGHQVSFTNEYALTLYSFEGEREGDLAFQKGEVIEVLEQHDSGWWIGRLGSQVGTFPYNYVQVM